MAVLVAEVQTEGLTIDDWHWANLSVWYFANRYGEQWIFTLDRTTGEATL